MNRCSSLVLTLSVLTGCAGAGFNLDGLGDVVGFALTDPNTDYDKGDQNLYALTAGGAFTLVPDAPWIQQVYPVEDGVVVLYEAGSGLEGLLFEPGEVEGEEMLLDTEWDCVTGEGPGDDTVRFQSGAVYERGSGTVSSNGFAYVQQVSGPMEVVQDDAGTYLVHDIATDVRYAVEGCNGPSILALSSTTVAVDDCSMDWVMDVTDGSRLAPEGGGSPPLNGETLVAPSGGALALSQSCSEAGDGGYWVCSVDGDGNITTLSDTGFDPTSFGGRWCEPNNALFATETHIVVAEVDQISVLQADGSYHDVVAEGLNISLVRLSGEQVYYLATNIAGAFEGGMHDISSNTTTPLSADASFAELALFGGGGGVVDPGDDGDEVDLSVTPKADPDCLVAPTTTGGDLNFLLAVYEGGSDTAIETGASAAGQPVVFELDANAGTLTVTAFQDTDENGTSDAIEPSGSANIAVAESNVAVEVQVSGCGGEGTAASPVALTLGTSHTGSALARSTSFFSLTPATTDVHTISLYGYDGALAPTWSLYTASDFSSALMTCDSGNGGYISEGICDTPSLTTGMAYYVAVAANGSGGGTPYTFEIVATEGAGSQPFLGTEATPSALTLGQARTFVVHGSGSGQASVSAPRGKAYGFYLTTADGALTLQPGYYDSGFVNVGQGSVSPDASNDQYASFNLAAGAGTLDLRAKVFNGDSEARTFDLEIREGVTGSQTAATGTDIALSTPTNIGVGFNDRFFSFVASGSTATVKLTDLTAGVQITVYDTAGSTTLGQTTGDALKDFTNELPVTGLTGGMTYRVGIVGADSFHRDAFGTLEITP
ncbi:MAG: hypothetical protein JRJ84_16730 [Deltaproteobacteria bacterium]|nr:hypothetical protein [Deltaproteobacteria bacterium]